MKEEYFVIKNSDGDTRVRIMTKEELLINLNEDGSGYKARDAMSKLEESDTNYWGDGFLVIKGRIVSPQAKEVVKEYAID